MTTKLLGTPIVPLRKALANPPALVHIPREDEYYGASSTGQNFTATDAALMTDRSGYAFDGADAGISWGHDVADTLQNGSGISVAVEIRGDGEVFGLRDADDPAFYFLVDTLVLSARVQYGTTALASFEQLDVTLPSAQCVVVVVFDKSAAEGERLSVYADGELLEAEGTSDSDNLTIAPALKAEMVPATAVRFGAVQDGEDAIPNAGALVVWARALTADEAAEATDYLKNCQRMIVNPGSVYVLPTSDTGLAAGEWFADTGVVTVAS